MQVHHVVPQTWLRRFSDDQDRLIAISRLDSDITHTASVRKLCREKEFNRIEFDSGDPDIDDDPYQAEEMYSFYEGVTRPLLDRLEAGSLEFSDHERMQLSFFFGLQYSRGWAFRRGLTEMANLHLLRAADATLSDDQVEKFLQDSPCGDAQTVAEFRRRLLAGQYFTLVGSRDMMVQEALRFAVQFGAPAIAHRAWRLLMFDEPSLGVSDNPIGLWSPNSSGDDPTALANCTCIYVPIGRKAALMMVRGSEADRVVPGTPARAKQVNYSVAVDAEKWLLHHPVDGPFGELVLPAPGRYVEELVSREIDEAAGTGRELWQVVRRYPDASS